MWLYLKQKLQNLYFITFNSHLLIHIINHKILKIILEENETFIFSIIPFQHFHHTSSGDLYGIFEKFLEIVVKGASIHKVPFSEVSVSVKCFCAMWVSSRA